MEVIKTGMHVSGDDRKVVTEIQKKDAGGRKIAPKKRRFSTKKRFIVNVIIIFAIK